MKLFSCLHNEKKTKIKMKRTLADYIAPSQDEYHSTPKRTKIALFELLSPLPSLTQKSKVLEYEQRHAEAYYSEQMKKCHTRDEIGCIIPYLNFSDQVRFSQTCKACFVAVWNNIRAINLVQNCGFQREYHLERIIQYMNRRTAGRIESFSYVNNDGQSAGYLTNSKFLDMVQAHRSKLKHLTLVQCNAITENGLIEGFKNLDCVETVTLQHVHYLSITALEHIPQTLKELSITFSKLQIANIDKDEFEALKEQQFKNVNINIHIK